MKTKEIRKQSFLELLEKDVVTIYSAKRMNENEVVQVKCPLISTTLTAIVSQVKKVEQDTFKITLKLILTK
jgi:hypothetical protein